MTGRRWLLLVLAGAASALLLARGVAQIYTDHLWYSALGAADVWRARYGAVTLLRAGCSIVATLFVFANLYAVRQSVVSLVLPRRVGNLDIGEEVPRRQLTWTAAALSAILGVALAWSQDDWSGLVAARYGVPFGESDPYFAADLGFYVYWLPFELRLFTWLLTTMLIVIGLVILLYALTPSLRWESGSLYVSGYVRRHLAMLAGALLLMLAWHHRLAMFTLLGGSGIDTAFGYLDHRVRIPANLVLSLVTLGAGLTVLWAGWTGQMRLAFAAITGVLVAVLGARVVAPFIVERTTADRDRERPYLATRAAYTRRAFALERVQTVDSTFGFGSLSDAAPWIPVWDEGALRSVAPLAVGASYGWSLTDSMLTVVSVAPGGALSRVVASGAGPGGMLVRQPDEARASLLVVPDSTARPKVVADSANAVAAPPLASRLARVAHSLSMQDFRLWAGELPQPGPKLVARRSVRERIAAVAPIFVQGERIEPVWSAGGLLWAVELYSSSGSYPLSRRLLAAGRERAYFQHAGTALVHASTGRMHIVADSAPDPIAATWMRRFPQLFERPTAQAPAVRRQLPPAREGGRVQAMALARFGLRGEVADGGRQLPDDTGADSALAAHDEPLLGIPSLGAVASVLPVLDRGERVRGLFIATGGPGRRALWWPLPESAASWAESLDRLHATDTLGPPQVQRGHARVVPVDRGVALVQPRYEWNGGERPRLMHLAVLERDSVRTPAQLLDLAPAAPDARPLSAGDFRARVNALYAEMRRALGRGDWVAYGRAFDELGALLSRPRE